ncbi:MAG: hypothetical protein BCS36_12050 [Desulfovibrio sp. MES5]|uniref:hypothetical protein n=1 Tax=Desulfovibrio sp. MES5 TaxID=1899016 RepID=UPI000B9D1BE1|nr:hypothetical protein [Desulfovibrio sp. MES5]OXS30315.1 MAG: hypothetical protein BCS36_12050 [Desulfovibrio sp. MES5]
MDGFNHKVTLSTEVEAATFQAGEDLKDSSRKSSKNRNRLSAKDKKAKREAVAADCRAGHPRRAIMLRHHLSKSQLNDFLAQLLMAGELTPIVPSYELALASTPIRSVLPVADDSVEYIRVEHTERGTLLTPYRTGDENELTC